MASPVLADGALRERPGAWALRERGSLFGEEFGSGYTQLESGLRFNDVSQGIGPEITQGTGVKLNFVGYVLENGKKFDSTWDKGRLVAFKVQPPTLQS